MNDNNENKSSINKYSNLTFRNNNILNIFSELLYTYQKNKNIDDFKYNINRSKQFYKKTNINQILNEANRDKKHNNKFIDNKKKK